MKVSMLDAVLAREKRTRRKVNRYSLNLFVVNVERREKMSRSA